MNIRVARVLSVLLSVIIVFSGFSLAVSGEEAWNCAQGEIFELGSYPQTKVEDGELISKLNTLEVDWKSYNYYIGTGKWYDGEMESSDFMKYADIEFDGKRYRAVTFSQLRPYCTGLTSESSYQDDNGYEADVVYWFRYEPLEWRVLDASEGFVVCEDIIDSQAYNNTIYYSENYYQDSTCTVFANNYEKSSIRKWLNADFYNTAFTTDEQKAIKTTVCDNSCWNPVQEDFNYANTYDIIFLLSYNDVLNKAYGFSSDRAEADVMRQSKTTDYAVCQGLNVQTEGKAWWWLRTAGSFSGSSCCVNSGGNANCYYNTNYVLNGIRPAMKINIKSIVPETEVKLKDLVMYYKNTSVLETDIKETEGIEYTVQYTSSNGKVATIDNEGSITATGRGTAEITCTVTDEYGNVTEDKCTVEVKFLWWQWVICIVLFGWIWY